MSEGEEEVHAESDGQDAATKPAPGDDDTTDKVKEAVLEHEKFRRCVGVASAIVGMLAIVGIVIWDIRAMPCDFGSITEGPHERLTWALIGAHSIITVAVVFFGLRLLAVSERMFVPASDIDRAEKYLGLRDKTTTTPSALAAELLTLLKSKAAGVTEGLGNAIGAVVASDKKNPD